MHDIQCAEICGVGHGIMNATIYIESEADHDAWINAHPVASAALPSTGGLAALDQKAGN